MAFRTCYTYSNEDDKKQVSSSLEIDVYSDDTITFVVDGEYETASISIPFDQLKPLIKSLKKVKKQSKNGFAPEPEQPKHVHFYQPTFLIESFTTVPMCLCGARVDEVDHLHIYRREGAAWVCKCGKEKPCRS